MNADQLTAACAILGWLNYHDPDLVQDAILACRHIAGVDGLSQFLVDVRGDTIRQATHA